jgi:hypothetical protein
MEIYQTVKIKGMLSQQKHEVLPRVFVCALNFSAPTDLAPVMHSRLA